MANGFRKIMSEGYYFAKVTKAGMVATQKGGKAHRLDWQPHSEERSIYQWGGHEVDVDTPSYRALEVLIGRKINPDKDDLADISKEVIGRVAIIRVAHDTWQGRSVLKVSDVISADLAYTMRDEIRNYASFAGKNAVSELNETGGAVTREILHNAATKPVMGQTSQINNGRDGNRPEPVAQPIASPKTNSEVQVSQSDKAKFDDSFFVFPDTVQ